MNEASRLFDHHLKIFLEEHSSAKVNAELTAEFKVQKNDEEIIDIKYFQT